MTNTELIAEAWRYAPTFTDDERGYDSELVSQLAVALAQAESELTEAKELADIYTQLSKIAADALAEQAATIEAVKAAYLNPGSHPEYHYQEKARLSRAWPTLAKAVSALSRTNMTERTD